MSEADAPYVPLAARMRPRRPEDFFGQEHLLGPDKPLANATAAGKVNEYLDAMLDKYYELRGWDKATGKPTPVKLKELSLEQFIKDIW